MPINAIVSEVAERQTATPVESGNAPQMGGQPTGEPAPTTMNNGSMLPPYLHNQTLDDRSALMLLGTVLGVIGMVRQVMG